MENIEFGKNNHYKKLFNIMIIRENMTEKWLLSNNIFEPVPLINQQTNGMKKML